MGVRPRHPHSLISGLMWFNADSTNNLQKARHFCDQGLDFQGFGWDQYDPRLGGHQVMKDNEFGIDIHTDFVKTEDGNWAMRVKGIPRPGHEKDSNSIVFYTALESPGGMLTSASGSPFEGFAEGESIKLFGHSIELDGFDIEITDGPDTNTHKVVKRRSLLEPSLDPARTHYMSMNVPEDQAWRIKDIFGVMIQESIQMLAEKHHGSTIEPDPASLLILRNIHNFEGNLHMVQKTFVGEFEFDIIYNTEKTSERITPENVPALISDVKEKFSKKFQRAFDLKPPFNTPEYEKFGHEVMSNLLGGIGYYYGDSLVDRDSELNEETYEHIKLDGESEGPYELFAACPSRTFFPRGFYWDEGFHLIPVLDYDVDLTLEILKSWFNLIDEDGWIAREQILGPEARSKVPHEFQVQSPKIANPPTLMLVFVELLTRAKQLKDEGGFNGLGDLDEPVQAEGYGEIDFTGITDAHLRYPDLLISYAEEIYPKLQRHYQWFRRTQKGELDEFDREPYSPREAYRWRGRTYSHCLPSGLDDYPRAPTPDVGELNVDLISWIGTMTRSMRQMAELLGKTDDAEKYAKIQLEITKNIEDLHWSETDKTYCDISVNNEDEDEFFCFKGYISLFPFLLKQMEPGNKHLKDIVELISDPDELFTPYGIRSLSKSDPKYKTGEDYWRSPIWYNINYLILDSLLHYGSGKNGALLDKETRELANKTYSELRVNLVENVKTNFEKTGYVFEQYNDVTGEGQGAKHFYGWTAVVTSIMKMPTSL